MFFDPLLYSFMFVWLFSPRPNVIMLTASGARFGFRRTVPHLFGVVLGVGVIGAVTALSVGVAILAIPALEILIQGLAVEWIRYMAWNYLIATRRPAAQAADHGVPMTLLQAALFQLINPKVWAVAFAHLPVSVPVWPRSWRPRALLRHSAASTCLFACSGPASVPC